MVPHYKNKMTFTREKHIQTESFCEEMLARCQYRIKFKFIYDHKASEMVCNTAETTLIDLSVIN
jgi:hypothetical protein